MMPIRQIFQRIPFYPLLLGIYPVLFLWVANFVQVPSYAVQRSLLVSIGITVVVCLGCLAVTRDMRKAGLLAGLALVIFFFYGQIFSLVDGHSLLGFTYGKHRYMLTLFAVLFGLGAYFILRSKSDLRNLTGTFNLVGVFLVGLSLVQLGLLMKENPAMLPEQPAASLPVQSQASVSTGAVESDAPDVYYFLLDGYDRQDLLEEDIHLDNQKFISDLENLGFVIPNCTQSNYTTTVTSMAATLNMNYIDALGVPNSDIANLVHNAYTKVLMPFLRNNLVMSQFHQSGYKIITLKTPYPFINYPNSDVVYDYQASSNPLNRLEAYDFEYLFLRNTMMRVLIEETEYAPENFVSLPTSVMQFINPKYNRGDNYFNQIFLQNLYFLDALDHVSQVPGKKFVYAHLLTIHPPFTFTPTGELRMDTADTKEGFAEAVTYTNQRMLTIIKNILSNSNPPPVIILQGDHAHLDKNRKSVDSFKILNAYYLPQNGKSNLYPTITPVNTFRLILSYFFKKNYPLIPDQSIWINPTFPNSTRIAPSTCIK